MININVLNQNNMYSLGRPDIPLVFSALKQGHTHTTTGNMGKLIPILIKEMQPNEKIHGTQQANIQFEPFVSNLMHQVKGEITTYFVPYRLIWNEFEEFITGGEDGKKNPIMPATSIFDIISSCLHPIRNNRPDKIHNFYQVNGELEKQLRSEAEKAWNEPGWTPGTEISPDEHYTNLSMFMIFKILQKVLNVETTFSATQISTAKIRIPNRPAGGNLQPELELTVEQAIEKILETFATGSRAGRKNTAAVELLKNGIDIVALKQREEFKQLGKERTTEAIALANKITAIFQPIAEEIFTHTLYDYLGLPTGIFIIITYLLKIAKKESSLNVNLEQGIERLLKTPVEETILDEEISTLPFLAYKKIYDDWIRLQDWEKEEKIYNNEERKLIKTRYANYDWDYFTRARRYQIRGAMPTVPVDVSGITGDYDGSAVTINDNEYGSFNWHDAMTAAALLNYYTANAKIRPRYREHLLSRWGIKMQDTRLQLSEFIAAYDINISQNGVVQTAPGSGNQTQQGHITGQLWGNGNNIPINYNAQEHGILISLITIKPSNMYEQGLPIIWKKKNKFELPIPELANLPDVPIYATEIAATDRKGKAIGYKTIYDEYRTSWNIVTGKARKSTNTKFRTYTLARKLSNANIGIITKCIPNTEIIKQSTEEPDFILILGTYYTDVLPMPYTSNTYISL